MSDTQQLVLDSAEKMFADHCDKSVLDAAEAGQFPEGLWALVRENGFHLLALPGSGAELADVFALLKTAGRYALPLPLAESLLASRWLNDDGDALIGVGQLHDGQVGGVPWGRQVSRCVAVTSNNELMEVSGGAIRRGSNLAGESRDALVGVQSQSVDVAEPVYELMALSRVALAAGALQRVLDLSVQYATDREQFGRAISKFQAIQHTLAVVAAEVAAVVRSADAAVEAIGDPEFALEVAAAKARTGEAIGIVAEAVHQVHGAMGFTYEHELHHFTRRLWAWREEYGNEVYWQARLGRHICTVGADNVWDFLATRA